MKIEICRFSACYWSNEPTKMSLPDSPTPRLVLLPLSLLFDATGVEPTEIIGSQNKTIQNLRNDNKRLTEMAVAIMTPNVTSGVMTPLFCPFSTIVAAVTGNDRDGKHTKAQCFVKLYHFSSKSSSDCLVSKWPDSGFSSEMASETCGLGSDEMG
jgi:hypothetical protein